MTHPDPKAPLGANQIKIKIQIQAVNTNIIHERIVETKLGGEEFVKKAADQLWKMIDKGITFTVDHVLTWTRR